MVGQVLTGGGEWSEVYPLGRWRYVEVFLDSILDILDGGPCFDSEGSFAALFVGNVLDKEFQVWTYEVVVSCPVVLGVRTLAFRLRLDLR